MALKRGSKKRYYGKKQGKGWKKRFFKLSLQKLSCISAQAKLHLGSSEAASRQKRSCISAKARQHIQQKPSSISAITAIKKMNVTKKHIKKTCMVLALLASIIISACGSGESDNREVHFSPSRYPYAVLDNRKH